jgi:hypothetical protein
MMPARTAPATLAAPSFGAWRGVHHHHWIT